MKKSTVCFVVLFALFFLTHLCFVAEANTFLNGASAILAGSDRVLNSAGAERSVGKDWLKVKVGGEFRYRLEYRNDFNFNDRSFEDDALNLFRTRLSVELKLGSLLRFFAEGQSAESVAESELHRTAAFANHIDLRQLYVEAKSPWAKAPLQVKVGRQELSYGDQRFVGAFDWSNVGRVFDAVKLVYPATDWFQADLWFSQVVLVDRDQADSAAHDDNFYGLYTTLKPLKDHVFDTFFFVRHNRNNEIVGERPGELGQLKEYTAGNRFKGKKWNFDYGLEWAIQFGSRAHDDIRAWAWHNEAGYTFTILPWDPRVRFEFNHASGDNHTRDGRFENFDNLFPTNHDKYGYMDFFSLRNMNDIQAGGDLTPHKRIKLSADYHWFFLDTNKSPWFNAGQGIIRRPVPGASRTVGQELDLLAKYKLTEHVNLTMGYSHFFPGPFVEDTGASDSADFFYTQVGLKV